MSDFVYQRREFQQRIIAEARQSIAAGKRAMVIVVPTGGGKTVIGADIIKSSADKGRNSMFMAHRRELVRQTSEKLRDFGVDHGIIMAEVANEYKKQVKVASIDTLRARFMNPAKIQPSLPDLDILFIDECHRALSPTYKKLIEHYKALGAVIIGLTATPIRGDGKGLGRLFDEMIIGPTVRELIDQGYLVEPRYFAPTIQDLTGVKIKRGDYDADQLDELMGTREAVGDIVTNWFANCSDRPTIVFNPGVKSSMYTVERFREMGVESAHIDAYTPQDERDEIMDYCHRGKIQLVSNCMVMTEGVDCPPWSCCILNRPTKNVGLYIQMAGRVLRPHPGKKDAIILDHSGNLYEHGYLDEDQGWSLEQGAPSVDAEKRQERFEEKEPICCVECSYVYQHMLICPNCGHEPEIRGSYTETRHAELVEVRRQKREERKTAKKRTFSMEEKQEWYSMFLYYAKSKGHSPGSVSHKYKEKFGVWPRNMIQEPVKPSDECAAFIKYLNIKFAKRRKKDG